VEVGLGVVVNPADGWYSADDDWEIGGEGVALQHSGVLAFFWAEEYQGTTEEYLAEVVAGLQQAYESFSTLPAGGVRVASDLLGLKVHFAGVSPGQGREEGQLAVVTHRGIGVTMWVRTWQGQMAWVQADLDFMLRNLVVPR
jgi:hypothetical protein